MLYFVTIRHGHFQDIIWGCHLNGNSPAEVKATATALYERDQTFAVSTQLRGSPPIAHCKIIARKSNADPLNAMNALTPIAPSPPA